MSPDHVWCTHIQHNRVSRRKQGNYCFSSASQVQVGWSKEDFGECGKQEQANRGTAHLLLNWFSLQKRRATNISEKQNAHLQAAAVREVRQTPVVTKISSLMEHSRSRWFLQSWTVSRKTEGQHIIKIYLLETLSFYLSSLTAFQLFIQVQFMGYNTWHYQCILPFERTLPYFCNLIFAAELPWLVKDCQVQMQN